MTTVLSLFSGVGGFDYGLEQAGMTTVYQCEIDDKCRSVLARHWSAVPRWADITTLTGEEILRHAPQIDVVAWGSPCQDLSIAGRRAGLEGGRSGLFYEGIRIINEIRKATHDRYPTVSIWENVAGALSSNEGADFGSVLSTLEESGACFSEWRVLDAQFFGIPQRRRRVFVISIFDPATAARCPDPLLPVCDSVRRNPKTGGETKEETAEASARCTKHGRLFDEGADDRVEESASDDESILSFDTQFGSNANVTEDVSPTIKASQASPSVLLPSLAVRQREGKAGGGKGLLVSEEMSLTLLNANEQMIVQPTVSDCLVATHTQSMTRDIQIERVWQANREKVVAQALTTKYASGDQDDLVDQVWQANIVSPALLTTLSSPTGTTQDAVVTAVFAAQQTNDVLRRLMPVECERLMGWADDHTRYAADGSEIADTHRYKMCGNGVASPVARWIGEHLMPILNES